MLRTNWLSWLKNHSVSQKYTSRRRQTPVLLGGVLDWLLEERCLLSTTVPSPDTVAPLAPPPPPPLNQTTIYVAGNSNKYTLLNPAASPAAVMFLGGTVDGVKYDVPAKLVTFTNNSSTKQTIYPFLYDNNPGTGQPSTGPNSYDPFDIQNQQYRLYIGYTQGGNTYLGLPYGASVTIAVPLVFWNGGRADIATDSANLLPTADSKGNITSANPFAVYYTKTSTYVTTQGVVASTDNGALMYYNQNTQNKQQTGVKGSDPGTTAQSVLTEFTLRDQDFLTAVNNYDIKNKIPQIPDDQLTTLINYDVSYVDGMMAPAAMTATSVPVPIQFNLGLAGGTFSQPGNSTVINSKDPALASLVAMLTSVFPYSKYTWYVKYNDTTKSPTKVYELGQVTNIQNGAITVAPTSGTPPKLPTNAASFVFYTNAVTQNFGWIGANNESGAMQNTIAAFTTNSVTQAATTTTQSSDKKTTTITLTNNSSLASLLKLLNATFPYKTNQWQVLYNNPNNKNQTIVVGNLTSVSGSTVTVTSSTAVSGLPTGAASYVFSVNGLGNYFGGLGWPAYYNPNNSAGLKIPAASNLLLSSPLTAATSIYSGAYYLLTSGNGGNQAIYFPTLKLVGTPPSLKKGAVVPFSVTGMTSAQLTAIKNRGGAWVLSNGPKLALSNPIATVNVSSINPQTLQFSATLNQDIINDPNGYSYLFQAVPSDPYTTQLTNLWYSWAQYYVSQYTGPQSVPNVTAKVTNVPLSKPADPRLLTLTPADWNKFGTSGPQVGMSVTGTGLIGLVTILKVDAAKYQIYLSAPVTTGPGNGTFTFSAPKFSNITGYNDPGLKTNLIDPKGFSNTPYGNITSFAKAFAANIYELLAVYGTVSAAQLNATGLPYKSMAVVYETIGGNVGYLPYPGYTDLSGDVRDLGKSVLRGVPNFLTYTTIPKTDADWKPGSWYPPPSTPTDNQNYNVFNLDPFVWFVHQKLGMSSYGFSFDDDLANASANGANTLTIVYSTGQTPQYTSAKQWYPSTFYGSVTALATVTKGTGDYKNDWIVTLPLTNLSVAQQQQQIKAFWEVTAGAFVSSTTQGIIPAGTTESPLNSNALTFVLTVPNKGTVTPTKPGQLISVTFTGYNPSPQSSSPPPSTSPPPAGSPPPHKSTASRNSSSSSTPSPGQELAMLVADEVKLVFDQVLVMLDTVLGITPSPSLESSIAALQDAINANPLDETLLGQLLLQFVEMEVLTFIEGLL